jgi:flagellar hook-length control protein FliK
MPPQRAPNETPSATQLIASTVRQAASDNTAAPDAQIQSGASAEPRPISGPGSAPQNAPAPASAKRAAPAKAIAAHSGPAPAATKDNFAALLANAVEARDAQGQSATSSQSLGALSSASGAAPASAQLEAGVHRAAPAAAQVGREIIRRFGGENTRFELRLDPPELGRVEVRLEVSRDHRVTAIVAAESPQALAELARHARDLEQTLQSAGLELAENGLSFDLSERQARASPENAPTPRRTDQAMTDAPEQTLRATPIGLERWRGQRVDLVA